MGIVGEELLDGTEDMISWLLLSELIFICLHIINLSSGVIVQKILAEQALLANGWASDVMVEVEYSGPDRPCVRCSFGGGTENGNPQGPVFYCRLRSMCTATPFKRAMAGLTECRGPDPRDTFWTWRELMYRFLDRLDPQQVEAIAAFVQMEMLEAGYAVNVEFHYLHHQSGGQPYDNLDEMVQRVVAATHTTGIGLTLLPVYYQYGGCDARSLGAGQIRFGNTLNRYADLLAMSRRAVETLPKDCRLGVAPHSLRAIAQSDLASLVELADGDPFHMHIAEQVAEVEEVQAAWGARPVEWLLNHADVTNQWCLIHCTQMAPQETEALARSGAVAGLCPITESSLGDGIFDGVRWLDNEGSIAVGSDSNIRISLSEELRTLDYSQRLRDRSRAALGTAELSTGRRIYDAILAGGSQAAGRHSGCIETGAWADMLALDNTAVDLLNRHGDAVLDSFIFAGDDRMVCDVWSAGRHMVRQGQHIDHDAITAGFAGVMMDLAEQI